MFSDDIKPWLFSIEPKVGESFSHFLGRVRRANHLTPSSLGKLVNIGLVVARWERFHLNPFPTSNELKALADVIGISAERLREMLPPQGVSMKCEPIRLCGACYGDSPCHRIEWQYQKVWKCDKHNLLLLSKCPKCEARFQIPALWEDGCCHRYRCRLPFGDMAKYQNPA